MFLHFLWEKIAKSPVKIHSNIANFGKIRVFEKLLLRGDAKSLKKVRVFFHVNLEVVLEYVLAIFLRLSRV